MIKTVLIIFLVIFAILGFAEFLHSINLRLFSVKNPGGILVVLKEASAFEQLQFAYSQMCWYGSMYGDVIIAVIDDLSAETLEKCNNYARGRRIVLIPRECIENCVQNVF